MLTKEQEEIPIKLLPQKPGQMRTMLITGEAPERGHWYSPDAVREMLGMPTDAKLLADAIARYLRQLGPHQLGREGGQLLIHAEKALRGKDSP